MDKYARRLQILEMQHKRDEIDRKILELQHEEEREKGSTGHREDRRFEEIVVEYPPDDLCTYPEYAGKPYFSIKYEENGEHIVGFGTYKPDVLTRYLKEYFLPRKGRWIAVEDEEGNVDSYYCSVCDLPMDTSEKVPFCPECGSRMTED